MATGDVELRKQRQNLVFHDSSQSVGSMLVCLKSVVE